MTPTQQTGYNDQKAGKLDPDLCRADTRAGREYRDGMRCARRDEVDALEGALHVVGAQLDPVERAVLLAEQVTPIDSEPAPSETKPAPDESNALVSGSNDPLHELKKDVAAVMGVPEHLTREIPAIIEPVYEKKRTRKAKPADADQGSLFS